MGQWFVVIGPQRMEGLGKHRGFRGGRDFGGGVAHKFSLGLIGSDGLRSIEKGIIRACYGDWTTPPLRAGRMWPCP